VAQAEKAVQEFVAQDVDKARKVKLLDGFACALFYQGSSQWLEQAEHSVRQALELAPQTLTLKGTLGAILVERGRFEQAEPLLRECLDRSPAQHDQGIASFYLGLVQLRQGKAAEGRKLVKHGLVLHPDSWLMAKAERNAVTDLPEGYTPRK
jgi:Tfp pilus assembly protein PilF